MKRIVCFLLLLCSLVALVIPQVMENKSPAAKVPHNRGAYHNFARQLSSLAYGFKNTDFAVTTVTVLLNLDAAEQILEPAKFVTLTGNERELGLYISREGIVGNWSGQPWATKEHRIPLELLQDNANVVMVDGHACLALAIMSSGSRAWTAETPGISVIDSSGNVVYAFERLSDYDNKEYQSIEIDKRVVSHANIYPRLFSFAQAGARAKRLERAAAKPDSHALYYGAGGAGILLSLLLMLKTGKPGRKIQDS